MPMEIKDKDEFVKLLANAKKVIVVRRLPKYIKIKARLKKRLYTIKLNDEEEVEEVIKKHD